MHNIDMDSIVEYAIEKIKSEIMNMRGSKIKAVDIDDINYNENNISFQVIGYNAAGKTVSEDYFSCSTNFEDAPAENEEDVKWLIDNNVPEFAYNFVKNPVRPTLHESKSINEEWVENPDAIIDANTPFHNASIAKALGIDAEDILWEIEPNGFSVEPDFKDYIVRDKNGNSYNVRVMGPRPTGKKEIVKSESKSIKEEIGDNYSNNIEYCPSCGEYLDGSDISDERDNSVRYTCYHCGNSFDRTKYYNESKSMTADEMTEAYYFDDERKDGTPDDLASKLAYFADEFKYEGKEVFDWEYTRARFVVSGDVSLQLKLGSTFLGDFSDEMKLRMDKELDAFVAALKAEGYVIKGSPKVSDRFFLISNGWGRTGRYVTLRIENTPLHSNKSEMKAKHNTDNPDIINSGKPEEEGVALKESVGMDMIRDRVEKEFPIALKKLGKASVDEYIDYFYEILSPEYIEDLCRLANVPIASFETVVENCYDSYLAEEDLDESKSINTYNVTFYMDSLDDNVMSGPSTTKKIMASSKEEAEKKLRDECTDKYYIPTITDVELVEEIIREKLAPGDRVYVTVSNRQGHVLKLIGDDLVEVELDGFGSYPTRIDTFYTSEVEKIDMSPDFDDEIDYDDVDPDAVIDSLKEELTVDEVRSRVSNYLKSHQYSLTDTLDEEDICAEICKNLFDMNYNTMPSNLSHAVFTEVMNYFEEDLEEDLGHTVGVALFCTASVEVCTVGGVNEDGEDIDEPTIFDDKTPVNDILKAIDPDTDEGDAKCAEINQLLNAMPDGYIQVQAYCRGRDMGDRQVYDAYELYDELRDIFNLDESLHESNNAYTYRGHYIINDGRTWMIKDGNNVVRSGIATDSEAEEIVDDLDESVDYEDSFVADDDM